MKRKILGFVLLLLLTSSAYAKEEIVFTGILTIKISEGGTSRIPEKLTNTKSIEYKSVITKINNKYYWTTRENVELFPILSGAYITLNINLIYESISIIRWYKSIRYEFNRLREF